MRIAPTIGTWALVGALVGGCDDPSSAPAVSTIAQTSTTYVTIPARTTTTSAAPRPDDGSSAGDAGDETATSPADDPTEERIHEIQSGDYLLRIARDYDVPINYIPEYNGWDDGLGHALVPGEEVRIPPSDWTPEGEGSDDSSAASDESTPVSSAGCDTYTIRSGDTPANVAADHGVTIDELNAANENTRFYSGFVVGITINIPC